MNRQHYTGMLVFAGMLHAVVTIPAFAQEIALKQIELPTPLGEHRVGVRQVLLTDPARRDPHAATARPIQIRIWYPADTVTGPTRPYMASAVAAAWRSTLPAAAGFETMVTTNSENDAGLSAAQPRWPVLLFSHGRSFPAENYQILLEQLASDGWVVVAISHPYEEAATQLPDGRVLPFQGPTWEHDSLMGQVLQGVVDELVQDAKVVLDWLAGRDSSAADPFRGRLALERGVGYAGHSLGGAAAVWTMQRDPRVAAVASWEGQVYRDAERPLRIRGPLLYMIGGANRQEFAGFQFRPSPHGGPVFELVLGGGWHISVGDLLFIYERYAPIDWLRRHRREIPPLRANQLTADYLDEFFGHYLLDRPLDLLWPDSGDERERPTTWNYPEVELRVYGG